MSFRSNPLDNSPTRALNLQKYLLLHSQHEALLSQLASFAPLRRRQSVPANFHESLPEEAVDADAESNEYALMSQERQLLGVNQEIKTTLTELLNCESVKSDRLYRLWVQQRLMEAERELKQGRRQSIAAGGMGGKWAEDMAEEVRV